MRRLAYWGFFCAIGLPGLGGLTGCAGVALQSRVRELTQRVNALTRAQKDAQARQEELENRLLLLTDQLESQRVSQGRRGAADLPVITLRAPVPSEPEAPREGVEFAGAATSDDPGRVRPLLRAEGNGYAESLQQEVRPGPPVGAVAEARRLPPAAGRRPRPPATPIPPSGDNLGVVPIPRTATTNGVELARATPAPAERPLSPTAAPRPAAPPPPAAPASTSLPEGGDEPMKLYRMAYEHVRTGRYGDAERDLREFVRRFPRHDYADNAQYWLGETYYARKTYSEAAGAFRAVVERWPGGNKAPDALLKLGFSLIMLGETQKGRGVLSQVVEHYPNTEAARLAERRLSETKDGK